MTPNLAPRLFQRVVVKLGTGILTTADGTVNRARISELAASVARVRAAGVQVAVVSSGAIGLGMQRLGFRRRPSDLPTLQSCAAVGQSILTQTWQECMDPHGLTVAQMLLTRDDLRGRERHLAVRASMDRLLALGVVPVINENDCVSTQEIRFGDNDVLSALVASLTKADFLFVLSTVPGLLDPATGEVVRRVERITPALEAMATGTTSTTSVGGMVTKLEAARIANSSGCGVLIGSGEDPRLLERLADDPPAGTVFLPGGENLSARKRWLAFFDRPAGWIQVDAGAEEALRARGCSLLARGIAAVGGPFAAGALVDLRGTDGTTFARGVSSYSSDELAESRRETTEELRARYPDRRHPEAIHRDSLVLLGGSGGAAGREALALGRAGS